MTDHAAPAQALGGRERIGLMAVELSGSCAVEEAGPLVRGVAVHRAARVLGVPDNSPRLQMRHLNATRCAAARVGLEPPGTREFARGGKAPEVESVCHLFSLGH